MTTPNQGRLTAIKPRKVSAHEARDITPCLHQDVDVFEDLLGIDLELEVAEHPIEGFFLDLLGRDLSDDRVVIVEDQFKQSYHVHPDRILSCDARACVHVNRDQARPG